MREPGEPSLAAQDELAAPLEWSLDALLARLSAALAEPGAVKPRLSGAALAARLPAALPEVGCSFAELDAELTTLAREQARRNASPGFFGFICSPGLATDPLAHAAGAALNQNVTGFSSAPGAAAIEARVLGWLAALAGLPPSSGGAFVSGASLGNFTSLGSAVYRKAGPGALEHGLGGRPLAVYASEEAHFSIERALRALGLGSAALRRIPSDERFRLDVSALASAVERDLAAGATPCAIVATAGTTATGAVDPLPELAALARRRDLWLHVDAAHGGAALFEPSLRSRLAGIEQADSLTLDLHKGLYVALDAGVVLLREPEHARAVFGFASDYVPTPDPASAGAEPSFLDLGLETSRRFRALPAYLALRHYGRQRLARNVRFNAECARYLAELVQSEPELELVSEPELSICCFRFAPPGVDGARLDTLNESVRSQLEIEGRFYLSPTRVRGRRVLRVCLATHATRPGHLRELVSRVLALGRESLRASGD